MIGTVERAALRLHENHADAPMSLACWCRRRRRPDAPGPTSLWFTWVVRALAGVGVDDERTTFMTVQVTRLADTVAFDPPHHRGVRASILSSDALSSTTSIVVGLSHYLPGGEAELGPQPSETVYVVVAGELVLTSDGIEQTLRLLDCAHSTAGTVRRVSNQSPLPASMLVIRTAGK